MRIVGGRLKGRRLIAPRGHETRPTTDRTRESVFNILESRFRDQLVGGHVGDLYAGTGAMGIEALSRGAARATFIDRSAAALKIVRQNIDSLGLDTQASIHRGDAVNLAQRQGPFDIIFLDPPFGGAEAQRAISAITTIGCIRPEGILVLETGRSDMVKIPDTMALQVERYYGDMRIFVARCIDSINPVA